MGAEYMSASQINFMLKVHELKYTDKYSIKRKVIESYIEGYIVALELSGKNIEANKCKRIYEDYKNQ